MTAAALFHTAFDRFVRISAPAQVAAVLRELARGLLGSVLVAGEGSSGTLSGAASRLDRFEAALRGDARLAGLFGALAFMRTPTRHWKSDLFVFDDRLALNAGLRPTEATAAQVCGDATDEAWRLRRAQRLSQEDRGA